MRLTAQNLSLERGGRRLLSQLSFALEAGEALVVTGPNGAGKSSLLRALAGFLPLSGGEIRWEGVAQGQTSEERLHYVGHNDALKAALTAAENLEFWAGAFGGRGEPRAALAQFNLGHVGDLPVRALSAGQKRRVSLARLIVASRPVWLLDEPTTALDAAAQARFAEILRVHLGEGGLVVAATHAPLGLAAARTLELTPARAH